MHLDQLKFSGWPHILNAKQFTRPWIEKALFPLSYKMETGFANIRHLLGGKEMFCVFSGESTRTRASFEIAMQRIGGGVPFTSPMAKLSSAIGKDESIADTVQTLSEYGGDVLVVRNDEGGHPLEVLAADLSVPIINAGDNAQKDKQHPSQALLDVYTIHRHLGVIDGLSVAMIGDLKNGRTVRSLCYILSKFQGVHIYLVSPPEFAIGDDIKQHLESHGVTFSEHVDLREVAHLADVFYQTRIQKNLGSKSWDRADESRGFTVINKKVLDLAKRNSIIMHPLPCNDEIVRCEVDPDPRAIYIKTKNGKPSQVRCGLFTRMALLATVVAPENACLLL